MLSKEKIREWLSSFKDFLSEQEWFQQLKGKWEELDPQSRNYLKLASFGSAILLITLLMFTFIWSVHSLKTELSEKKALLTSIQNANEEIRQLKETIPSTTLQSGSKTDGVTWNSYFDTIAITSGIDKSNLTISAEKPGNSSEQSKETLFDIGVKHVNIKQIVHYMVSLENGQRPVKIRNLLIDNKGEPTGYLDANLAISGFTLVEQK